MQKFSESIFGFFTSDYSSVQRILTIYIIAIISLSCLMSFLIKQPKEPLFIISMLGMMLSPNIMWYHHYVFILLPLLIWMGWSKLDKRVIFWCLLGMMLVQIDRRIPPYGLTIHMFSHISLLIMFTIQIKITSNLWKNKDLHQFPNKAMIKKGL